MEEARAATPEREPFRAAGPPEEAVSDLAVSDLEEEPIEEA
jgi:hypothetical protein